MTEIIGGANIRHTLAEGEAQLRAQWIAKRASRDYLTGRTALVDSVVVSLWQQANFAAPLALAAVGGYGRGELFPCSDVDLLILVPESSETSSYEAAVSEFLNTLWDTGLQIGHSVRTVTDCLLEAEKDITVQTALLEARLLAGNRELFQQFSVAYRATLDPSAFLKAKLIEQTNRYSRFQDTPYALEPNCKESPGGLRDLHLVIWAARAANIEGGWVGLASAGLLRPTESRQLALSERRLQDLRISLHLLANRAEERLLFDYQERLAKALRLAATDTRRASEVLMQLYYRNARRVMLLSAMIIPALTEYLAPNESLEPVPINDDFQSIRGLIDILDPATFERSPTSILECFKLQMQRTEIRGMTPRTQRALWHARRRIDEPFRSNPVNRQLFLSLFQQPHLIRVLRRMNQYDILGRYLPAFGAIVGQMQHDLFHAYTVDQHILQVMRNLRRFAMPEFAHEYPFCSRLMVGFERHWLLYLAALFHDIAKGRGGDHSQLGMADVQKFGEQHELSDADTDLLSFLVENHLKMSSVAQKQDLADPEVVREFAALMGSQRRLTALYLLTVADIRGTSPKVWNSWKAKLLEDLFRMSSLLLKGEVASVSIGVTERQEEARRLLRQRGLRDGTESELWEQLDTAYFLRHEPEEIAWHTRTLYYRVAETGPVVTARLMPHFTGVQVMVYVPDQPHLFARLCYVFTRLGFAIADAKIHTTRHNYALDSFIVVSADNESYRESASLLEHAVAEQLSVDGQLPSPPTSRLSRQVKHFPIAPQVEIRPYERGNLFVMDIIAADRAGLLYAVARVLADHEIRLHTAKVATLGERIEDVFLISGKKLENATSLVRLEQDLLAAIAT
ncbi:MAG: [protein-PII] uridylyltransferase [Rhodocyclaceae bacterium]|jgi:[protein-PII] uridylyltransferase|nr:[protein-PII] uridylyltransferase [Rhodocyclaceae bacterium]